MPGAVVKKLPLAGDTLRWPLFLWLLLFSERSSFCESLFVCKVRNGFASVGDRHGCSGSYVLCLDWIPYVSHCPLGLAFDLEEEECVLDDDLEHCPLFTNLVKDCEAPKKAGLSVPGDSRVFYNCSDGQPAFYVNARDQFQTNTCIVSHVCGSGRPFRCPLHRGMLAHEHFADLVYLCHGGDPEVARCAPGRLFHLERYACFPGVDARFPTLGTEAVQVALKNIHKTALEKLEASLEKLECPSGFGCFPVSEDEFHYLECVKWKPTLRRCPDQSVFNASLGICTLFD